MAYFPFYVDISDQNCLVAGGGKVAYGKIRALSEFDVRIKVVAPHICDQISILESEINRNHPGQILLRKKEFEDEDISDMDFVIAATDNKSLNSHISELCRENNTMVNVVDVKEECTFIFPAIIKKEDMVVGISTGGNSPGMAAKMKKEMEDHIPDFYGEFIKFLGENRDYIKSEVPVPLNRKKVYDELIELGDLRKGHVTGEDVKHIIAKYKRGT